MKVDWLVVGAGLTGATFAERIARVRNERVLVIDQRDHIGGNTWDEYNEHGILEHKYGPHIFHTNSAKVWNYLSNFTAWRPYFHKVLASVDGTLVPLPFNLNTIDMLFPSAMATVLSQKLISAFGFGSRVPILKLREADDSDLKFLADFVYKKVFERYTLKQWGLRPEELAPSVTARVPILVSRDDRYFQDVYQAMPLKGYSVLVRNMLCHRNIGVMTNTRWQDISGQIDFKRMIFTGPVDEYFDFKHGPLPYRSLRFDVNTHDVESYQAAAVVNYPNEYDWTRVTELKRLTGQHGPKTTLITEYPMQHVPGSTIPYYPIPTEPNQATYSKYEQEAQTISDRVTFAGRLGEYVYYNMDQAVARALKLFEDLPRG